MSYRVRGGFMAAGVSPSPCVVIAVVLSILIGLGAGAQSDTAWMTRTVEVTIPSKTYPEGRHAWVYTPVGYPESCRGGCNLVLAFDGSQYLMATPLPQTLDSLTAAKRTAPAVALLFDNGAPPGRIEDLANTHKFAAFVAEELIPWVRAKYRVTRDPSRTLITGSSAGGLGAAYIAMNYPTIFGNVFSQSGAFWRGAEASNEPPYEWLTEQFSNLPTLPIKFVLDVGDRETGRALGGQAPSLVEANRHLRATLLTKGYSVEYLEVPGGVHSPESWRKRLAAGIVALLPVTR